jgi:hypothetical protein
MTEQQLRQLFKDSSKSYTNIKKIEDDGSWSGGEIVQAITEDKFIEILSNLDIIDVAIDDSIPRKTLHPFKKIAFNYEESCELCRYGSACSNQVYNICINELEDDEYYLKTNEEL